MSHPRIAIIGAGPAGLTLARLLAVHSIDSQVFEREPSPNSRSQGGSLDLHDGSGQQAVHDSGLWDEFRKHARYDGQEIKFLTKSCDVMFQEHPKDERDPDTKPEIDRKILREMFLKSLGQDTIKWGYALESIQPQAQNSRLYDLHFNNGKVEKGFDLVVGADGARSHIRSLLSPAKPFYASVSMVEIDITRPDKGEVDKLVGPGSVFAFSDEKGLIIQRQHDKSIGVYVAFGNVDEIWIERFTKESRNTLLSSLLSHFEDWDPVLQDSIRLAEPEISRTWPLYMLPVDHKWDARPGVTLIGDAAHLMTPFAGEGVNVAMWDALELSRAIVAGVKDGNLDAKIRESEVELFKRAEDACRRTENNMKNFIKHSGPPDPAAIA